MTSTTIPTGAPAGKKPGASSTPPIVTRIDRIDRRRTAHGVYEVWDYRIHLSGPHGGIVTRIDAPDLGSYPATVAHLLRWHGVLLHLPECAESHAAWLDAVEVGLAAGSATEGEP